MFLVHGKRKARIKQLKNYQRACQSCRAFDFNVKVYREYYHVFWIPICPVGEKTVVIRCNNCSEPLRSDSLQKDFAKTARTPFYLYALPFFFAAVIASFIIGNIYTQWEKKKFVNQPEVGDVYKIRSERRTFTTYYFLRLVRLSGDTAFVYPNNLEYLDYISKLNDEDYFVKDNETYFLKDTLKQMLKRDEINAVERNYGKDEGFDRIK